MTAPGAASPVGGSPPPELVARFEQALARLWPQGGKLGLAVSGGPDSLAMLLLAEAAIPGRFEVATVDHGLRRESATECAMVAAICAERSIPAAVLRIIVGPGNVQAAAREARYDALDNWTADRGLSALATAHQADDQAETLLMRLNRASGLAGLAGVREVTRPGFDKIIVIRPLLTFRRFELQAVVDAAGLQAVHDPSNDDPSFERVRIRKALSEADWLDPRAWAQSAAHLAEAEETMAHLAHQVWMEDARLDNGEIRLKYCGLRALQRRLLDHGIRELDGKPRGKDVDRLLGELERLRGGNVSGVLVTYEFTPSEGAFWVFRREPPRRG